RRPGKRWRGGSSRAPRVRSASRRSIRHPCLARCEREAPDMRVALFADIHANRQAFAACLAQAREFAAERIVLLGDYVGYGADPTWCIATVQELIAGGALAVR